MDPVSASGNETHLVLKISGKRHGNLFKLKINPLNVAECSGWIEDKEALHGRRQLHVMKEPLTTGRTANDLFNLLVSGRPEIEISFSKVSGVDHHQPRIEYKKGGDRNLKAWLSLKGKYQGGSFRVTMDVNDFKKSTASIRPNADHLSPSQPIKISGQFLVQTVEKIRGALRDPKGKIVIHVDPKRAVLQMDPVLAAPVQPALSKGVVPFHIADSGKNKENLDPVAPPQIINATELAWHLKRSGNKDPKLAEIAQAIIREFRPDDVPSEAEIQEITPLPLAVSEDMQRQILEKLSRMLKEGVLDNPPLLSALTAILTEFKQARFEKAYQAAYKDSKTVDITLTAEKQKLEEIYKAAFQKFKETHSLPNNAYADEKARLDKECQDKYQELKDKATCKPLDLASEKDAELLGKAQLVNIAKALMKKLGQVHIQDHAMVQLYLQATVALLDVMVLKEVSQLRREEEHDQFYAALNHDRFLSHDDLETAYQAQTGIQDMALIPNDESTTHSVCRRTWHFAKGLAKIADAVDLLEPWHIISALESVDEFAVAFEWKTGKAKWFGYLSILKQRILAKPHEFLPFASCLLASPPPKEIKEKMEWENPFFVRGFVGILAELLAMPAIDPNVYLKCIELLQKVWEDNKSEKADGLFTIGRRELKIPFTNPKKYQASLCKSVLQLLYNSTIHTSESVRKRAMQSGASCKSQGASLPLVAQPFDTRFFPSALFDKAVTTAAITHFALKNVRHLEEDPQVVLDMDRFVYPEAQLNDQSARVQFPRIWEEFKKSNHQVLTVEAHAGYGKSLLGKLLALTRARMYDPAEPPVFYFSLPRLDNPLKHLLTEGLKFYGIQLREELEELRQERFICVCDSFDEMRPEHQKEILAANIGEINLYPHAQFVFTYRKGTAAEKLFNSVPGKTSAPHQHLAPFTSDQIYFYASNYVKARDKAQAQKPKEGEKKIIESNPWSLEQYVEALKELLTSALSNGRGDANKAISNPLFLSITLEVLPYILAKLKKEYMEQNPIQPEPKFNALIQLLKSRLQRELFDAYLCVNGHRESLRIAAQATLSPIDIVDFQMRVASAMYPNLTWFAFPLKADAPPELVRLLQEKGDDAHFFLQATLMKERDGYSFRHLEFRDYCESIVRLNRQEELRKFIESDNYDLRNRIRLA